MSAFEDDFEQDDELTEFIQDPLDQAGLEDISFESDIVPFKSGRRIPERWTGVISLDHDNL